MLSCKQSTEMMSQERDRPLGAAERLSLRFHLLFCSGCRNFRRQMAFLQRACRELPAGIGDGKHKP